MKDGGIAEAISDINEEINELTNYKIFLESLDESKILTENEWHIICETNLRNSDVLIKFVQNIWPNAEDISVGSNYVKFTLYDFVCYLPTYKSNCIEIDTSWFHRDKQPTLEYHMKSNYRLMKLKRFVESDNWKDKAKNIIGRDVHPIIRMFRWFTIEQFKQKQYIEEYIIEVEHNNEKYEYLLNLYNTKVEENKKMINKLKQQLLPELNKFSSDIRVFKTTFYSLSIDNILHYYDEN